VAKKKKKYSEQTINAATIMRRTPEEQKRIEDRVRVNQEMSQSMRAIRKARKSSQKPKPLTPAQKRSKAAESRRGRLMPKTGLDKLTEALTQSKKPKKKKRR